MRENRESIRDDLDAELGALILSRMTDWLFANCPARTGASPLEERPETDLYT